MENIMIYYKTYKDMLQHILLGSATSCEIQKPIMTIK